jgi:cupin fold WbuC family metalloprotein
MTDLNELAPNILASKTSSLVITQTVIDDLKHRASASPLKRARILAHGDPQAPLHEMLIVQTKAVYVRPHRHHGKSESLHVIDGSAKIVYFNDVGNIEETLDVGPSNSNDPFFLRTDSPRWHMQIVLTPYFVFHEVTNGPFRREDTEFAPWAPDENDAPTVEAYLSGLSVRLGVASPTS